MVTERNAPWCHDHVFGQDRARPGERRTHIVIAITAVMMVVEIAAGVAFGSMALLADGLHMGSHAAALVVNALAYAFARRWARDPQFAFGTGKLNALGGFTGAVLLAGFALLMVIESFGRLLNPVTIDFDQAIFVAVMGLLVNGASALILGGGHEHHPHAHSHAEHAHPEHAPGRIRALAGKRDFIHRPLEADHGHDQGPGEPPHAHEHHDHNLRSAYLHVLADALTSVLAIFALTAGKLAGATFLDPVMGVVGAILVGRWSWGLVRQSGRVLLDRQAPDGLRRAIAAAIEADPDNQVTDLHVWSIGPGIYAAEIGLATQRPRTAQHYKDLLPAGGGLVHVTVEVHHREGPGPGASPAD